MTITSFALQLLNSIAYGSILFMIASGFSLIFGLMRMTNMVHVVLFALGSYITYYTYAATGFFSLAILVSAAVVGGLGFVIYQFFLSKLYGQWQSQVLLCLGFLFLLDDMIIAVFDPFTHQTPVPPPFNTSVSLFGMAYPAFRLMLIVLGVVIIITMELMINRTNIGAMIRSGVDDTETTMAMGVNIKRLFVLVYVGASVLAAVGGGLGGVVLGMEPKMCFSFLPIVLAIVIIGGLGNLKGTFWGSMIVAILDNFGKALFPEFVYFTIFAPMAIILVLKPQGLFAPGVKKLKRAGG